MWVVPAPVAGIWRGKIETAKGPQDCQLTLHQRLSDVDGTLRLSGKTNLTGGVGVDMWGDHVRFFCNLDRTSYGRFQVRFDGHVKGDTMKGTLAATEDGRLQECEWKAQRGKADFTGTWEWPCASGPRSVKLRIERRNGRLIATYLDGDQELPVTDFYDYGGGFYFTLLIGRQDDGVSIKITEDTGWLIGEAVLDDGTLKGKIEFYPWSDMSGRPAEGKPSQAVIQDWTPRLVKP